MLRRPRAGSHQARQLGSHPGGCASPQQLLDPTPALFPVCEEVALHASLVQRHQPSILLCCIGPLRSLQLQRHGPLPAHSEDIWPALIRTERIALGGDLPTQRDGELADGALELRLGAANFGDWAGTLHASSGKSRSQARITAPLRLPSEGCYLRAASVG